MPWTCSGGAGADVLVAAFVDLFRYGEGATTVEGSHFSLNRASGSF